MVEKISFNGSYSKVAYSRDLENIAKYTAGAVILPECGGPFEGAPLMIGMTVVPEAIRMGKWFFKYNKPAEAWANEMAARKINIQSRDLLKKGGWQKFDTYKTLARNQKAVVSSFESEYALAKAEDFAQKFQKGKFGIWNRIKGKLSGKGAEHFAEKKLAKLNQEASKVAEEATAAKALANGTEIAKEALTKGSKVSKFIKGNALIAGVSALMETFTTIIPAFKLGTDKGVKQIGKSAVGIGASVGGWAAGDAIGKVIGGAIGTFVAGPAGTAIGAVIGGFIAGSIVSWGATKLAEGVVGKSEVELDKEAKAKALAKQVQNDPQLRNQFLNDASAKLEQEGAASKDAQVAFKSLQRVAKNTKVEETQPSYNFTPSSILPDGMSGAATQQGTVPMPSQQNYLNQYYFALQKAGIPA